MLYIHIYTYIYIILLHATHRHFGTSATAVLHTLLFAVAAYNEQDETGVFINDCALWISPKHGSGSREQLFLYAHSARYDLYAHSARNNLCRCVYCKQRSD